jgi:hypothetical protein
VRRSVLKRSAPAREWALALAKVEEEGQCRACGRSDGCLEAAHVLGREHDVKPPLVWDQANDGEEWEWKRPFLVAPQRIIPLCGPVSDPTSCHGLDHAGKLNKLKLLRVDEQLQAVADAGGIENARVRLDPDDYTEHMRAARVAQIAEAA